MKIIPIGSGTGITPITVNDSKIIVGFDFGHFNKESPEAISYKGIIYMRGPLEIVPHTEYGDFCSIRGYTKCL